MICYLTAGLPDEEGFLEHCRSAVEGGADVLEVGVPFSDPVADGMVIQMASARALASGVRPAKVFELVRQMGDLDVPIVLMGYYNPIFVMGEKDFVSQAKSAGADGLIVADLPMQESESLGHACRKEGLDLVQIAGPTTGEARMRSIADRSSGFLYLVSSLGTTGARDSLPIGLHDLVRTAKRAADRLPVAVGFGISRAEQVHQVIECGADGAIVGSALLAKLLEGATPDETRAFVRELKSGTC